MIYIYIYIALPKLLPIMLIEVPMLKIMLINLMTSIMKDESLCGESKNSLLDCSIRDGPIL